ncbi:MAG: complex I NDUFA9 subunit family protein [Gammaproteobacteria bacterium]|nr:complex I NDUFA9 subunit family protein [Gammaproteobacteria bacterium]
MTPLNICLLGGSGFVGHALAQRLAPAGHRLRVLTRNSAAHRDLLVLPSLVLVDGDVHNPVFLRRQFDGMDVVVNLVGILNERGHSGAGFVRAHVDLPATVAEACREAGVARLLHMSALGAAVDAPSHYLRTKARGEDAAHAAAPDVRVTSFRPAVIFGPHDSFTNRFAGLLKLAPGVFPLACADARLQPVYVDDVARAFEIAIDAYGTYGQRYDLCGPKIYRLRELVEYIAEVRGRRVCVVGIGDRLSRWQAALLDYAPGKPFSLDNYRSLTVDGICAGGSVLRSVFDIEPKTFESVVPSYLKNLG